MTPSVVAGWAMVLIGLGALASPVWTHFRGGEVASWWKPLVFGVTVAGFGIWFANGGGVGQVFEWLKSVKEVAGD